MPASSPTDAELVARCLEADEEAWQLLVDRYQKLVYGISLRQGLSVEDAEDVFVETFRRLLDRLEELQDRAQVRSWLATTARRSGVDLHRRRQREARLQESVEPPSPTPGSDEMMEETELRFLVHRALAKLGESCQQLLRALYIQDPPATYEQVSKDLGMAVGSIGPTRARCLDKLRDVLRGLEVGTEGS